jgi:CheY-like chemotaxis protein
MSEINMLIVEDERNAALTLAEALRRASGGEFTVDVCYSAYDALALLPTQKFALVITDLRLPGMSGLELITHIRRHHPHTRTILMTGFGTSQVEAQARRMTDAYLTKPFNLPDVLQLVKQIICASDSPIAAHALLVDDNQLEQRLDALRAEVNASYVMLLDLSGNILVQSGNAGEIEQAVLHALFSNSMAASAALANAFKESRPFDLHYYDGEKYEIYLRKVTEHAFLALVLDLHSSTARMGAVWLYLKRTVDAIRTQVGKLPVLSVSAPMRPVRAPALANLDQQMDDDLFGDQAQGSEPRAVPPQVTPSDAEEQFGLQEAIRRGILSNPSWLSEESA